MTLSMKKFIVQHQTKILFLIYLALIVLATPFQSDWWIKISFWFFSLFLFWLASSRSFNPLGIFYGREPGSPNRWWLLLPIVILVITRLLPFLKWGEFPLGYDTGIYLKSFESCFVKASNGGCLGSPFSFFSNLLLLVGWPSGALVSVFYVFLNIFAGFAVYLAAKAYFNQRAAFFAFLLFAVSSSQFLAFRSLHWIMMVAIGLTFMAFYLLKKQSWLVIPVAGFMGAIHPLSFLPFGLALLARFITGPKRRLTFFFGLVILLVACSLAGQLFLSLLPYYTKGFGLASNQPAYMAPELTGQFVNFDLYRNLILIYLPFAILGLVKLIAQKRFNILFFYFLFNFAIIYFHLIFHQRFIILLDLVAIVLAGDILADFTNRFFSWRWWGKAILGLLLIAGVFMAFYSAWQFQPLVYPDELAEIKSLARVTEPNALVMTVSSYYSPWVYGFGQRKTIAPGLFEYNKWDLKKWQTFWLSNNQELRHQFLDEYQKPLYIFIGDKMGRMDFSGDAAFQKIGPRIWQYIGR